MTPEYLRPREGPQPVVLCDPDPAWASAYAAEEARIRAALGDAVVEVHHAGSTSVPGLAAKPVIDVVLLVRDSADEDGYVPVLEAAGYDFHLREPEWYEHRVFKRGTSRSSPTPDGPLVLKVNLHVFTVGSAEAHRMLVFRDWLREHPEDRGLYERTKRELASRSWARIQDYADAKSDVVTEILRRALDG